MGAQLLKRSGRIIRLTDAGRDYVQYARRAPQDPDAGRRPIHEAQGLTRGDLRLAMTPSLTASLIGPLVENFNARYPKIKLSVTEMNRDRVEALLAQDAFGIGMEFTAVRSCATRRRPLSIGEFEKESLVPLSSHSSTREHIDRHCQAQRVKPQFAIKANSIGGITSTVNRRRRLLCAAVSASYPLAGNPWPQQCGFVQRRVGHQ
ncbi:LysR substrate-binding domain-containing protein [Paraburkholderia xenovorans]|uniref:LysR substrate-binding domain-containing protein n=1 Tax=Paraburkholderia xenovorans TaxID=36873 RepID=UPI0038B96D67